MLRECSKCRKNQPVELFKQVNDSNKFFSKCKPCRIKAKNGIGTSVEVTKTCRKCSKDFVTKNKKQYLCSKECAVVYRSFEYKCKNGGSVGLDRFRFEVFKRDDFTCQYCGRNVKEDKVKIELDHVVPKSKGGTDTIENFTTACRQCNQGKHAVLLEKVIK